MSSLSDASLTQTPAESSGREDASEMMAESEPWPISDRTDTILLPDTNGETTQTNNQQGIVEHGDDAIDNEGVDTIVRHSVEMVREQAQHVCDAFPKANFDQCFKRLARCMDIQAEMQTIVDELNLHADKPATSGREVLQNPKEAVFDQPAAKRFKTSQTQEPANLEPSIKASDSLNGDILWIQVQYLLDKFPNMDPNVWYLRLEQASDIVAETEAIVKELEAKQSEQGRRTSGEEQSQLPIEAIVESILEDGDLTVNHPVEQVLSMVSHVRGMFPDSDFEICFRRLMRSENLQVEAARMANELSAPTNDHDVIVDNEEDDDQPGPSHRGGKTGAESSSRGLKDFLDVEQRQAVESVLQIFPDCDPYFVVKEIAEANIDVNGLIDKMMTSSYPKLKDRLAKERQQRRREDFLDPAQFRVEAFLQVFPDPEAYFTNVQRAVGELYRVHALTQLQNDFPNVDATYLTSRLQANNNHYLPAFRSLREEVANTPLIGGRKRKSGPTKMLYMQKPRGERVPFPDDVDELFYRELQYHTYYDQIKDFLKSKADLRKRRVDEARDRNQLAECLCCFADDILPDELISCGNGASAHQYCKDCVMRHAEEIVGQGRHQVTCLSEDCKEELPLSVLRRVLQPRLIDLILRRSQQEEIRHAGINNMESCPFCDFAVIMDAAADDDRIFRCQNPDCLKQSCRLCKEPNHVPLKCDEVERADETAMRTFIENRMAEALIRTCPKCGRRIVKEDGCNKVACPCGAYLCYVCQEVLNKSNPYAHFDGTDPKGRRCPLHTQMYDVHSAVAKKAGEKARDEYLDKHPELRDVGKKPVDVDKLVDASSSNSRSTNLEWQLRPFPITFRGPSMAERILIEQRQLMLQQAAQAHAQWEARQRQLPLQQAEIGPRFFRPRPNDGIQTAGPRRDGTGQGDAGTLDEGTNRERIRARNDVISPSIIESLPPVTYQPGPSPMYQRMFGNDPPTTTCEWKPIVGPLDFNQSLCQQILNTNIRGQPARAPARYFRSMHPEQRRMKTVGEEGPKLPTQRPTVGRSTRQSNPNSTTSTEADPKSAVKKELTRLKLTLKNLNNHLIDAQRKTLRENNGTLGAEIRQTLQARDEIYKRLMAVEARALKMNMTEEEMKLDDDSDSRLTKEDIEESIAEATNAMEEKRIRQTNEAVAKRQDVVERALMSTQYYVHVANRDGVSELQLREMIANIRETVLRPMRDSDRANSTMFGYFEGGFVDMEKAFDRRGANTVVPLREYTLEMRNILRSIVGELQRLLDSVRNESNAGIGGGASANPTWTPLNSQGTAVSPAWTCTPLTSQGAASNPTWTAMPLTSLHRPNRETGIGSTPASALGRQPGCVFDSMFTGLAQLVDLPPHQGAASSSKVSRQAAEDDDELEMEFLRSSTDPFGRLGPLEPGVDRISPERRSVRVRRERLDFLEGLEGRRSVAEIREELGQVTRTIDELMVRRRQLTRELEDASADKEKLVNTFTPCQCNIVSTASHKPEPNDTVESHRRKSSPIKKRDETQEVLDQRNALTLRVRKLIERLDSSKIPASSSRRLAATQQQLFRLLTLLDPREDNGALTEERLGEIRGFIDHYDNVITKETAYINSIPDVESSREDAPSTSAATSAPRPKQERVEVVEISSDDEDRRTDSSEDPTIEWEFIAKPNAPAVSVKPKYSKIRRSEKRLSPLKESSDDEASETARPLDEPPFSERLFERFTPDAPPTVLDAGYSSLANMMSGLFGNTTAGVCAGTVGGQQPQRTTPVYGAGTPNQQLGIASPGLQNFVQINVNVQPTGAFQMHLQQQQPTQPARANRSQDEVEEEDESE